MLANRRGQGGAGRPQVKRHIARRASRLKPYWRALTPLLQRRPFLPDTLLWARERRFGLLKRMVADGLIDKAAAWSRNLAGMRRSFGLHPHGALAAEPHRWAQFHEPQITRGLCHFLTTGSAEIRRGRSHAVVAALWGEHMPQDLEVETQEVRAEDGRIDLAIVLTAAGGRRVGAIVEAKFGHHLTPYQLKRYRWLASHRWELKPEDRRLVVVMSALDFTSRLFLRRNPEWRFLSWERLLVRLDNLLDASIDDEDFRRFRRTIWLRAYDH